MMDNLHGVLKSLSLDTTKNKQATPPAPDHLDVFREFLSHMDRAKRQPSRSPRPNLRPHPKPKAKPNKR